MNRALAISEGGTFHSGAAIYFGTRTDTINDVDPSFGSFSFDQF